MPSVEIEAIILRRFGFQHEDDVFVVLLNVDGESISLSSSDRPWCNRNEASDDCIFVVGIVDPTRRMVLPTQRVDDEMEENASTCKLLWQRAAAAMSASLVIVIFDFGIVLAPGP